MRSATTHADALEALIAALQRGEFGEAAARRLHTLGPDAVALALLAAARRIADQDVRLARLEAQLLAGGASTSTPSGQRPISHSPSSRPAFRPSQFSSGAREES